MECSLNNGKERALASIECAIVSATLLLFCFLGFSIADLLHRRQMIDEEVKRVLQEIRTIPFTLTAGVDSTLRSDQETLFKEISKSSDVLFRRLRKAFPDISEKNISVFFKVRNAEFHPMSGMHIGFTAGDRSIRHGGSDQSLIPEDAFVQIAKYAAVPIPQDEVFGMSYDKYLRFAPLVGVNVSIDLSKTPAGFVYESAFQKNHIELARVIDLRGGIS